MYKSPSRDGLLYIVTDDGETITDPELIHAEAVRYFNNRMSESEDEITTNTIMNIGEIMQPLEFIDENTWQNMMNPITIMFELKDMIKVLPNDKAHGPNGIPYELYKIIAELDDEDLFLKAHFI